MPVLPKRKVGLISCSGEELPAGTLSRVAALKVLERLRPNETVTLCLPLFLAGDDKERAFARFYPTIAIDGCDKRCAARATEKYSAMPTASLVIPEFLGARGLEAPHNRRQLDAAASVRQRRWRKKSHSAWTKSSGSNANQVSIKLFLPKRKR